METKYSVVKVIMRSAWRMWQKFKIKAEFSELIKLKTHFWFVFGRLKLDLEISSWVFKFILGQNLYLSFFNFCDLFVANQYNNKQM